MVTGCPVKTFPVRGNVTVGEYVVPLFDTSKFAGAVTTGSAVERFAPLIRKVCAADAVPVTPDIAFKALVDTVRVGMPAWSIVKICAFDIAVLLATVIDAVPAEVTSEARIEAVICVGDTYAVVLFEPFQRTILPFMKFCPLTVSGKAPVPAIFELGTSDVIIGVVTVTFTLSRNAVWAADVAAFQYIPISVSGAVV